MLLTVATTASSKEDGCAGARSNGEQRAEVLENRVEHVDRPLPRAFAVPHPPAVFKPNRTTLPIPIHALRRDLFAFPLLLLSATWSEGWHPPSSGAYVCVCVCARAEGGGGQACTNGWTHGRTSPPCSPTERTHCSFSSSCWACSPRHSRTHLHAHSPHQPTHTYPTYSHSLPTYPYTRTRTGSALLLFFVLGLFGMFFNQLFYIIGLYLTSPGVGMCTPLPVPPLSYPLPSLRPHES